MPSTAGKKEKSLAVLCNPLLLLVERFIRSPLLLPNIIMIVEIFYIVPSDEASRRFRLHFLAFWSFLAEQTKNKH